MGGISPRQRGNQNWFSACRGEKRVRYQLPKVGKPFTPEGKKQSEISTIAIYPDKGESLEDLMFRIVVASIVQCPIPRGWGFLDPRAHEPLLTIEDLKRLQEWIKREKKIKIDYWKGHPVKTLLTIENDHILFSFRSWLDRWNAEDWAGWVLPWTIDALSEVLRIAAENTTENLFAKAPLERRTL